MNKNVAPTQVSTLRDKDTSMDQIEMIKSARSEAEKSRLRAQFGLKEVYNPLFSLSVDLYRYVLFVY